MLEALEQLRAAAIRCADAPVWSLSDADVTACIDLVQAAELALAATKLHLVRQAETRDLPRLQHARNGVGWLRTRLRVRSETARRLVDVSRAADCRPDLDAALTTGAVNLEQAQVIDRCLTDLPSDVGIEAIAKAETLLIGYAAELDPDQLRAVGRRILVHVAPEIAEQAEAAALEREEVRAYADRFLTIRSNGAGKVRLNGLLDSEAAAVVTAALDPLCAPRCSADTLRPPGFAAGGPAAGGPAAGGPAAGGPAAGGPAAGGPAAGGPATGGLGPGDDAAAVEDRAAADDRTIGQRRADALVEVCRLVLATGDLPVNGGDRPQMTVTVPFDVLRGGLGVGTLDTGERLTPTQTRRLACDAQVLPAVLGGEGQVLDVGQARRLITGPMRRALVLRDRGCAFPGCSLPPRWTDGHHIVSWVDGGATSLDNSVLLCGHHHRTIHRSDWQIRLGHDRIPDFIPPAHLDLEQRPRRNLYHRRT